MIGVYPSRSIPLTNPFSGVANQPFTYRPSIQWTSEEPPAIHQLKSCNYRAVRPKPLPPPSISPFFRREPVRWLLMADSVAGRPNYVKHRLLLVMSPWQVTGRAGQFSSNNTLNIKLDSMEMISFLPWFLWRIKQEINEATSKNEFKKVTKPGDIFNEA